MGVAGSVCVVGIVRVWEVVCMCQILGGWKRQCVGVAGSVWVSQAVCGFGKQVSEKYKFHYFRHSIHIITLIVFIHTSDIKMLSIDLCQAEVLVK